MTINILIDPTQLGGSAYIEIGDNSDVKVGVSGVVSEAVAIQEFNGVDYTPVSDNAAVEVLNVDTTSAIITGPGKYKLVLPATAADTHVYAVAPVLGSVTYPGE